MKALLYLSSVMSRLMRLFYNININGNTLESTYISPNKVAVRELLQKDNSYILSFYLQAELELYCKDSDYKISRLILRIEKLFNDFENNCYQDYGSDELRHLLELHRWEQDFISIVLLLRCNDYRDFYFKNTLLCIAINYVLNAKLLLFKNIPDSNDSFRKSIEHVCQKTPNFYDNDELKSLMASFKRIIRKFSKEDLTWSNTIPMHIFRTIEAEKYFVIINEHLRDYLSFHAAGDFQSDFRFYRELLQYEGKILSECYNDSQKSQRAAKRSPRKKSMESYILDCYDKKRVIDMLRKYLKGKHGKQAVMVIRAAYSAGLTTTERIPYSTVTAEFGNIGAQSGYHHFFDKAFLTDDECKNLTDTFRLFKAEKLE